MEPIAQQIFRSFEVRKTYQQKTAFIAWVQALCREQDIPCRIEEGGLLRSRNIILGDPDTARVLFTAHYDTCARMPFPNLLFPRHFLLSLLVQFVCLLPFLVLVLAAAIGVLLWTDSFVLYMLLIFGCMGGLVWLLLAGPANPHTANDNTSGVVTVLELLPSLQKGKAAAVLFDHEELGMIGSSRYSRQHRERSRELLVLNFDCVSDGEHLLFVAKKKAAADPLYHAFCQAAENAAAARGLHPVFLRETQAMYPSDQMNFPRGVGIAACRRMRGAGYFLSRIHTAKDTIFEENNLQALAEAARTFIQEECQ